MSAAAERVWRNESRWVDMLLAPPELAFRALAGVYHGLYDSGMRKSSRSPVPVISVGNLTVGGTGKTPFTRWVVERLLELGATPAILHGGYGEDEPALHRAWFPGLLVIVGKDRVAGAHKAAAAGATVAVLDDGFQHRRLRRDIDLVLIAAEEWQARPRLLPRGRWREPPGALKRATLAVVTRKAATPARAAHVADEVRRVSGVAVAIAALLPAGWRDLGGDATSVPPEGVVGVTAIGQPDLFFQNAEQAGAQLSRRMAFRDHHVYDDADLASIRTAAGGQGVVTTAKDALKLVALGATTGVWILEQRVVIERGAELLSRLLAELSP